MTALGRTNPGAARMDGRKENSLKGSEEPRGEDDGGGEGKRHGSNTSNDQKANGNPRYCERDGDGEGPIRKGRGEEEPRGGHRRGWGKFDLPTFADWNSRSRAIVVKRPKKNEGGTRIKEAGRGRV